MAILTYDLPTQNLLTDVQLDYLTSATYGDGLSNASQSWTYDAAGNRSDAVTDNLNRATSIGNATIAYTYDSANDPRGLVGGGILGNRLVKTQDGVTSTYGWDALNRMTSYTSGGITTSYAYRADGMRVSKSDTTGSAVYRYDGQMCMQDVETVGSTVTTTNYALGARGIDAVSKTVETFQNGQWVASPAQVGYPIYDAHGDRVATLTKSGTSFSLTDVRSYDAWGNVRVGAQTGRPRSRYCANLGHVQDDESDLVYMRARYYEPTSGRFVSEDASNERSNPYTYCNNNPVGRSDIDGNVDEKDIENTLNNMWSWFRDLNPLGKSIAIYLIAKFINKADKVLYATVVSAIGRAADSMMSIGYDLFLSGAAEFVYSSSAGSAGQALGWGLKGAADMMAGASIMAAGIAIQYAVIALVWIDK